MKRVVRWVGMAAVAVLALGAGRAGAATYYVNAITPGVNVGSDGTTTMTTLADVTVTAGSSNANRAMTNTTAPTGTTRWRISEGAAATATGQEFFRAYTPTYSVATTIAANATAYADFYMRTTGGTSCTAKAALYEYNDTTGIVGTVKGTTAGQACTTTATTRQTLNNQSFGNAAFTVAAGNRLMVVYLFDMAAARPAFLWGQAAGTTPSGYQSFTVTETVPPNLTIGQGTDPTAGSFNPGVLTKLDGFTLATASGSSTVSAIDVALTNNTALTELRLYSGTACSGTQVGTTITNPGAAPSFGTLAESITTTAKVYSLCGTGGAVATATAVTGNVSGVTYSGTFNVVDQDTSAISITINASTVTIGNGTTEPGNGTISAGQTDGLDAFVLTSSYLTPTVDSVTVALTGATSVSAVSINSAAACNGTSYGSTTTVGASTTVPTTGLTANGGTYYVCVTASTTAGTVTGNLSGASVANYAVTDSDTGSSTITVQAAPSITTSIADGSNPTPGTVGPVTTPVAIDVDGFDVSFTNGSDAITAVQVTLGTTVGIGRLAITNASNTELGFITTIGSLTPTVSLTTNITAAGSYKIRVTPLSATAMPAPQGGTYTVTARITDITVTNAKSVADTTSGTLTIDNWSPSAVATLSSTPGSGSVKVAWATEPADADFLTGGEVVVLVRQDLAPTSVPVEGVDYAGNETFVADGSRVGCVTIPGQKNCTVSGLTSPNNYYFTVFARDAFHNYSVASTPLGPVQPSAFVGDGDTIGGSTKPVISIIDPMNGATLSQPARIQVRIFSPGGRPLAAAPNAPKLLVDGADPGAAVTALGQMTAYPGSTTNVVGVWEFRLDTLTASAAGIAHTLRATASNTDATGIVYSGSITVVLKTGKGDGNLLVRDNSSQLCSDCHAGAMSHSSESTGTKFGSWATTCRDCHTPHKTTNISLIKTAIKPPERTGPTTAQPVVFLNRNGYASNSFASPDAVKNGVCQVCHTATGFYRADGTLATHETAAGTNCAGCHDHKKGFKGSCTNCHGTEGFIPTATLTDSNIASAPPALVGPGTPTPNTPPTGQVTTGNGHLLHLDRTRVRSAPIQCNDCHLNYSTTHRNGAANVNWGTLATSGAVTPQPASGALTSTFSTNATCTNWCHGSGLKDGHGTVTTWDWKSTVLADCSSCHGQTGTPNVAMPSVATAHHPQNAACVTCHGVDYSTAAQADRALHIDGTIQKPANGCTACHGDLAGLAGLPVTNNASPTSAPGYTPPASADAHGKTATTDLGVGAHKLHMDSGMIAMDCTKCHGGTLPADTTHADGTIAIGFLTGAGVTNAPTTFVGWASPGSCTTYCHSRGEPLGTETNSASAKTWAAASYSAATCASCHGDKSTLATNAHEWHFPTGYGMECQTCHVNTATGSTGIVPGGGSHLNGSNNVGFNTTGDARTAGASWTSPSCAALYCHSNGTPLQGADSKKSVAWNATAWIRSGATANECTQCHAMAADNTGLATSINLSHAHYVHATTYGYECARCHNGIATGAANYPTTAGTIVDAAKHVNQQRDVAFNSTPVNQTAGSYTWTTTAPNYTCNGTYCHSNGQSTTAFSGSASIAWNTSAASDCTSCHGGNAVATGTKMSSGSHTAHVVNEKYACGQCHGATVNTTSDTVIATLSNHVDGTPEVQLVGGTWTKPTCSVAACHGAGTPTWGGSVACGDCHLRTNLQGGDAPVYGGTFPLASSPMISSDEWTAGGHGQVAYGFGVVNPCLYCHDNATGFGHKNAGNPFRLRGPSAANGTTGNYDAANNVNAVCLNCHALGSNGVTPSGFGNVNILDTNVAKKISAEHYGAAHPPTGVNNGGKRCWDCHDGHGDANLHMVGKNVVQTSSDNHGWTATRLSGIVFTASALGSDYAAAGSLTKICSACHTSTKYYRGVTGSTAHETGACIPCHAHQQPPSKAFTGSGACSACHMGAASASSSTDRDEFPPSTATGGATPKSLIDPEEWYGTGHGRMTTKYAQSDNPAANFPAPSPTVDPCYYCHAPDTALFTGGETSAHADVAAANPFRLLNTSGGTNPNGVCLKCHSATGGGFDPDGTGSATYGNINRTTSKAITATHYGARHTGTADGGSLCWDCHDPHGDYNWTAGREIAYMIQALPLKDSSDTTGWGKSGTFVANTVDFNKATGGVTTTLDWGDYVTNKTPATTNNGVCQVCHSATTHFKSGTWTTSPIAPDTDYDANHNTTGSPRCTGCHAHEQVPNLAFRASCTGCHGNKGTARVPATGADAMLEYAPPTTRDQTTSATTANGVGAHISHVNQTTFRANALSCAECHGSPLPAAGHPSAGQAPVPFNTLAKTGGITTAAYTQGTGCAATYCHGNFTNGYDKVTAPSVAPGAPTITTISSATQSSLTVTWTAGTNATLYKVERATAVGGPYVQVGITTGLSFVDGGLNKATDYWYQVRSWNTLGDSAYSGTATGRTLSDLTPTEFDMVGEATATTLPTDGVTNVLTATTSLVPTTATTFTNRNVATQNYSYSDTTRRRDTPAAAMTAGTTYNFIDIYSPPLTTGNLTVDAGVQVSIDLYMLTTSAGNTGTWTATVYEFTSAGASTSKGTCTANYNAAVTTQQTVACTASNTQWTAALNSRIKVRIQIVVPTGAAWGRPALLWGANRGATSGQTYFTAGIGTPAAPPPAPTAAPTGLTVGGAGQTSLTLSWSPVTNAASYIVERSAAGANNWAQVGQPATTSFMDDALTPNTAYDYRVRATNASGSGSNSATVTGTTAAARAPGAAVAWTGTFTVGSTTLGCTRCHGDPPTGTHPADADRCSLCHDGYGDRGGLQAVDAATHIDGVIDVNCIGCHTGARGTRRAIVPEFAMAWSHKRSAGGAVDKWDCIVCHMEGDPATGLRTAAHQNGNVNLRDPDTGLEITNVTFSVALGGTSAGAYAPAAGNPTIATFGRNLAVALDNDTANKAAVQAIQVNLCLKCHDSNGAAAFNGTNPLAVMANKGGTRSAAIPFGTPISYANLPATLGGTTTVPSGTQTAGGIAGGVIRVDTSFDPTIASSYHPVSGRNNNSYANSTRMAVPYNTAVPNRVAGTITTGYGYLISCWDCHAPNGTGNVALTSTVTAHGGATTVRGKARVSGTPAAGTNESTLCKVCHALYNTNTTGTHGAGSAITSSTNGGMGTFMAYGCNACHSSAWPAEPIRPVRSEDFHGVSTLPAAGTKTTRWAGTDNKPYAFIRNTGMLTNHSPKQTPTTAYTATCTGVNTGSCNNGMSTYTVGGTY